MTTVYGVTFVGAREQIEKQLKDRKDLPEEECWLAASYLAKKVGLYPTTGSSHPFAHYDSTTSTDSRMYRRFVQRRDRHPKMAQHMRAADRKIYPRGTST